MSESTAAKNKPETPTNAEAEEARILSDAAEAVRKGEAHAKRVESRMQAICENPMLRPSRRDYCGSVAARIRELMFDKKPRRRAPTELPAPAGALATTFPRMTRALKPVGPSLLEQLTGVPDLASWKHREETPGRAERYVWTGRSNEKEDSRCWEIAAVSTPKGDGFWWRPLGGEEVTVGNGVPFPTAALCLYWFRRSQLPEWKTGTLEAFAANRGVSVAA